jgi:hypothetical protein
VTTGSMAVFHSGVGVRMGLGRDAVLEGELALQLDLVLLLGPGP